MKLDEDVVPKYVSFETDHFSIYTLAENPNGTQSGGGATGGGATGGGTTGGTDTGDSTNMWVWLVMLCLSAVVLGRVAIAKKRSYTSK